MHLGWLSTGMAGGSSPAASSLLPLLWRMLGALLLGVFLAKWSWLLFAPNPAAVAVVPEHGATVEAGRLFGIAVAGLPAAGATPMPNVRLVGVFAARIGQPGFAVLKLDEKRQVGVIVGDKMAPGTKLLEVHPNYVLLDHDGAQQRVDLENKPSAVSGMNVVPGVK